MSCEGRAWLTNQPGVSLCIHVFHKGFGQPLLRARVKEARPLYFCLQAQSGKFKNVAEKYGANRQERILGQSGD